MSGLLSAWLAEVVLIAYRSSKSSQNKPIKGLALPSEYASSMIIYGALAFLPEQANGFAAAVGWGLVLATFLNLWQPGKTVNGVQGAPTVSAKSTNQGAATNVDTKIAQTGA